MPCIRETVGFYLYLFVSNKGTALSRVAAWSVTTIYYWSHSSETFHYYKDTSSTGDVWVGTTRAFQPCSCLAESIAACCAGKHYATSAETDTCSLLTLYRRGFVFLPLGQKGLSRFSQVLFLIKQTVQKTCHGGSRPESGLRSHCSIDHSQNTSKWLQTNGWIKAAQLCTIFGINASIIPVGRDLYEHKRSVGQFTRRYRDAQWSLTWAMSPCPSSGT